MLMVVAVIFIVLTSHAGMISHWKLDDVTGTVAIDSFGDNDGILMEMAIATSLVEGKVGGALEFDGVDDYVECGDHASLDITDEITIEAWFNTTYEGSHSYILDKLIGGWGWNIGYGIFLHMVNPN